MRKVWQIPALVFLWAYLALSYGCAIPGPSYYPLASRRALTAGSIIKDEDVEISEVRTNRLIINGFRASELDEDFTAERSRVIGHKALRNIPAKYMIHLSDISK